MQLVIDIGNTVAKLAAFRGDELLEVAYTSNETLAELPAFCCKYPFKQAIWCSVVNLSAEALSRMHAVPVPCLHFTHTVQIPIRNAYATPETLGLDRLAAVVGAQQCMPHRDLLVPPLDSNFPYYEASDNATHNVRYSYLYPYQKHW